jgi:hypothetical protein
VSFPALRRMRTLTETREGIMRAELEEEEPRASAP